MARATRARRATPQQAAAHLLVNRNFIQVVRRELRHGETSFRVKRNRSSGHCLRAGCGAAWNSGRSDFSRNARVELSFYELCADGDERHAVNALRHHCSGLFHCRVEGADALTMAQICVDRLRRACSGSFSERPRGVGSSRNANRFGLGARAKSRRPETNSSLLGISLVPTHRRSLFSVRVRPPRCRASSIFLLWREPSAIHGANLRTVWPAILV